jgi:hypothetical protein
MPGKPFTKKGWKAYHALRKKKGMSKKSAARIVSSKKGTRLKGRKK